MNNQFNKENTTGSLDKIAQDARKVAAQAGAQFDGVLDTTKHVISDASQKMSKSYDVARQELSQRSQQVEGIVKKYPLLAVGAAASLGWMLGRLFKGSPKSPSNPNS
jgi:ElaB/YqjD/DUF883 family membrane-anchored ribosome-binding protein